MINIELLKKPLYHGSIFNIHDILLEKGDSISDFGRGFYTTTCKTQAINFVQVFILSSRNIDKISTGFINCYQYEELFYEPVVKVWPAPCEEWLKYVAKNRRPQLYAKRFSTILNTELDTLCDNITDTWDIVIGPVADDWIGKVIRSYLVETDKKNQR